MVVWAQGELAVGPAREAGCATWLVALAAYDLAHGDHAARDWTEWIPVVPLRAAHRVAREIAGPTLVRAAGREALRDGTAHRNPAAHTSAEDDGDEDDMDDWRSA
jgi:hypothetical protein